MTMAEIDRENKSLDTSSTVTADVMNPKQVEEAIPHPQPIDVQNPKAWPFWKKVFHTAVPGIYGFTVTLGSSVYVPGIGAVAQRFNVSREVAILGLALYSQGLGLGPMIGAPISEALGRRGVYLITGPLFLLFTLGAGLAQNIETLLICRVLAATFGSPALAVSAGTVADLWDMQSAGGVASVFLISTIFLGPSIGPVIGGYTWEDYHSWRWLQWAILLSAGPILFITLFTDETSLKHIQAKAAKKQGIPPPPGPPPKAKLKMLLVVTLLRPLKMMVKEPIVIVWALYHAFIFGVLFGFFGSYYYVFMTVYGFSIAEVGPTFLAVFIGILLAIAVFCLIDKLVYQKKRQRNPDGKLPPEERLYVCMVGAFCMPISLFWFAWTANKDIFWLAPVAAGVPFGCGLLLLFVGGVCYLLDTYGALYSASAMAANGITRYTFGMAFPLFTTQMYMRLGVVWATQLLAFISLVMLPIPFVLYKYGPNLRARSIFIGTST